MKEYKTTTRILLITDDESLSTDITKKLLPFNYAVRNIITVSDTVLQSIPANQYEAVLIDLNLKNKTAVFEYAERLFTQKTAPVLFVSSEKNVEPLEEYLDIPVYGYLCRCTEAAVINASIQTAVRLHRTDMQKNTMLKNRIENRLEKLATQVPGMLYIFKMDPKGKFTVPYSSKRVYDIFGCNPEDVMDDFSPIMNTIHPEDRQLIIETIQASVKNMAQWKCEYRVRVPGREMKWIYGNSIPEQQDDGAIIWHGYNVDITLRKKAEEEVKKQLDEKIVLLREVHHRLKNNLLSISGLLSIQAEQAKTPESHEELQHAVTRLQSMQLLYSKLLVDGEYDSIDIKQYIETLIDTIMAVYEDKTYFTIQTEITDFKISAKKAFPLGIIINELLTNTIKYAFDETESGNVGCTLVRNDDLAVFELWDNGKGCTSYTQADDQSGFGLHLVEMLASQINGTFSIENKNGTYNRLTFTV